MKEISSWEKPHAAGTFTRLEEHNDSDLVIIGGGITGLTTAYLASLAGYSVVVLEKETLGIGTTGLTTAFLTQSIDTDFKDLIDLYEKDAATIIDSHGRAISIIEDIIEKERIPCDFMRCPDYIFAANQKDAELLESELTAAQTLGLQVSLKKTGLPFQNFGYLEILNQAKFDPTIYIEGLITAAKNRGVLIYEMSEVERITEENETVTAHTKHGSITARHALAATYMPFGKELGLYFKKASYTSYVYELSLPRDIIPSALYEDTETPYHYMRLDAGQTTDRLIIGGEDHRSDIPINPEKNFNALHAYAQNILKNIPYTIEKRWSGPIIEPVDGLPFIGRIGTSNLMHATGFSGNGMTYATIAAKIMLDHMNGKEHAWAPLYTADRTPSLKALAVKGGDFAEEFIHGAGRNMFRSGGKDDDAIHA